MVTMVMTAPTPMTMPRMVSVERSTFRRISRKREDDGVAEHYSSRTGSLT